MKQNDYIVIQAPMVTDLKLSGNRLIIYAIINGFSKDGQHEFTGSINYLCDWTNLSRNTVISTLKSLVDDNLIKKREYMSNNVKFCAYSVGSAKIAPVVQTELNFDDMGSEKIAPNNIEIDNNFKEKKNILNVGVEEFIDRIYKKYPSRCPIRQMTTGKTLKDKQRIKNLLKTYSMEDIERVVDNEIEVKYGKYRMQNFSTFLNNFPDPQSLLSSSDETLPTMPTNDDMVINGQIYR